MEFNQVEPHIDIAATSKKITEDMETSVCNPQVNTIDVHGSNGPTASDTKPRTSHNVSSDDAAADGVHQKRHVSPVRMSRSEVLPQARTYSMNFAECGSESFSETSNGWCEMNKLIKQKSEKPKSKSIAVCQPVVTLDDIEMVDRAVGIPGINSAVLSQSSYFGSLEKQDEEKSEKSVRQRHYVVTPRPSLREYKDANDDSNCLPDLEEYRSMLSNSRLSTSFSSAAPVPPAAARPRRYCDTTMLVCAVMITAAGIFIWAVIHNMEPAFISPLMK